VHVVEALQRPHVSRVQARVVLCLLGDILRIRNSTFWSQEAVDQAVVILLQRQREVRARRLHSTTGLLQRQRKVLVSGISLSLGKLKLRYFMVLSCVVFFVYVCYLRCSFLVLYSCFVFVLLLCFLLLVFILSVYLPFLFARFYKFYVYYFVVVSCLLTPAAHVQADEPAKPSQAPPRRQCALLAPR
jgi:hypothetical protein